MTARTSAANGLSCTAPTRFCWIICALLFFATTINYMDRGVLGVMEYGDINAARLVTRWPIR